MRAHAWFSTAGTSTLHRDIAYGSREKYFVWQALGGDKYFQGVWPPLGRDQVAIDLSIHPNCFLIWHSTVAVLEVQYYM